MGARQYDRIVVGGGVMGLSAAWQLARTGLRVLLLERFEPGTEFGASHGATRNFNSAYEEPYYLDLFDEAERMWRQLESDTGRGLIERCGLVTHGDPGAVARAYHSLRERGSRVELIAPAQAERRWSGMRFEGQVLVDAAAGRVNAATAIDVLATEAKWRGVELRTGHRVVGIEPGESRSTVIAQGPDGWLTRFEAEGVVVAAGAWSRRLLAGVVDLPRLVITEEHPAHFRLRPASAFAEAGWPSFNHFRRGAAAGSRAGNVYGMLSPGEGVKVAFHGVGPEILPDQRAFRASDEDRAALRSYVSKWLPALDPDSAVELSCTYTSTRDGRFILDRRGTVTVAAGFSGHGFKFAPAVGRILADLSTGAAQAPAPFRLAAHGV